MYVLKIDLVSGKTVCDLGSGRTIELGSSVGTYVKSCRFGELGCCYVLLTLENDMAP